jgi:hypothetical protein
LYILDTKKEKNKMFKLAAVFLAVSAFCVIFNLIYSKYGHGVHSNYMTFMFAYPLMLGAFAYLLVGAMPKARLPGRFVINTYNSGIATLTAGSMLRGIFDIAGTSSPYQLFFMIVGAMMVFIGAVCYVTGWLQGCESALRDQAPPGRK